MVKTLLVFFLFLPLFIDAQAERRILYSDLNIKVEAILQDCERKDNGTHIQYYYLKIINHTSKKLTVSFKREIWYNKKCLSCNSESQEYLFIDTFLPEETKQGDCNKNTDRQYRIFSKMLNLESKSILTDFNITNIKIEEL